MRTVTIRTVLVSFMLGGVAGSAQVVAQSTPPVVSIDQVLWLAPGLGGHAALERIRDTSAGLSARSATYRHLLDALSGIPNVSVHLRPRKAPGGRLGHGEFRRSGAWLVGTIVIDPFESMPLLRARAIAHELGHLYELACLHQSDEGSDLLRALQRRGAGSRQPRATETPFAGRLEDRVLEEFLNPSASPERFSELTVRHRLANCRTSNATMAAAANDRTREATP